MTIKVTVEKIASNKQGFAAKKKWYNFYRDGEQANLPANIKEGGTLEITEYEKNDRGSFDFTRYKVSETSAKGSGYSGSRKSGGEDEKKQISIICQNALTNAVAYHAQADNQPTPAAVIKTMKAFAGGVLTAVAELQAKKAGTATKPATKKPAPKEDPPPEEPEEDLDEDGNVDDPYKV